MENDPFILVGSDWIVELLPHILNGDWQRSVSRGVLRWKSPEPPLKETVEAGSNSRSLHQLNAPVMQNTVDIFG